MIYTKEEGMWQNIVKAKYLRNKSVASVKGRFSDSPCWKALLKIKDFYFAGRGVDLKQGDVVRLWKDKIRGEVPFSEQFPELYDICQLQDCTVAEVVDNNFMLPFRRNLQGILNTQWEHMMNKVQNVVSHGVPDVIFWNLTKSKMFSTKSMYTLLEKDIAGSNYKWIWRSKIPLKIKIFMWQLFQDAVLTRDNMKKRNWGGSPLCSFCANDETAKHLFFECSCARYVWGVVGRALGAGNIPNSLWQAWAWFHTYWPNRERFFMVCMAAVCWAIWKTRNRVTFDAHVMRSPNEIVFLAGSFLNYWAGLQKDGDKEVLKTGAAKIMQATTGMFVPRSGQVAQAGGATLMITGA